jgi:hypothetical protein
VERTPAGLKRLRQTIETLKRLIARASKTNRKKVNVPAVESRVREVVRVILACAPDTPLSVRFGEDLGTDDLAGAGGGSRGADRRRRRAVRSTWPIASPS